MKCEVIIPVGPGHQDKAHRAVNTVAIAEMTSRGKFTNVDVLVIDDTQGLKGRSKARNEGVEQSTAPWLFFLDADDMMMPNAFESVSFHLNTYDGIWGQIWEYKEGLVIPRYQIPRVAKFEHLLAIDPYLTLQMSHFIKREVALENLFNEEMDTGEDWDYYLRVWKKYKCVKARDPFIANVRGEHSTGPRSADGGQWRQVVEGLIKKEIEEIQK